MKLYSRWGIEGFYVALDNCECLYLLYDPVYMKKYNKKPWQQTSIRKAQLTINNPFGFIPTRKTAQRLQRVYEMLLEL